MEPIGWAIAIVILTAVFGPRKVRDRAFALLKALLREQEQRDESVDARRGRH